MQTTFDPAISEWGNPLRGQPATSRSQKSGRQPGEVKHLSTRRKRNQSRDSVSSGERKRNSQNLKSVKTIFVALGVLQERVGSVYGRGGK
ncbi:MAG: hypothetical protein CVV39_07215 [Planctomycetes bacterium HGW-Planctomycetes-1]|nr:MAG: hypothetical protein CVV39_07215 [Planctomycetes bacterium HGW-Planctomycetes-1]